VTALTLGLGRELVERLGWCLVHSVWQLAAVGLIAGLILRGLRRGSAQARYLAACAAMAAMAGLPELTFTTIRVPGDSGSKAGIARSEGASRVSVQASTLEDLRDRPGVDPPIGAHADSRASSPITWDETLQPRLPGLVIAWGVVVFVLSVRLVVGWLYIQWLVRFRRRPAPDPCIAILGHFESRLGLGGAVRLLESARVHVPMVVGWLRPVVLLPVTAITGLSSDQLGSSWRTSWLISAGTTISST
jgi:hypothetical protein